MSDRIRNILGMLDEGKRIYRVQEGEVQREEFEYCQVIDQLVFGPKGYVETLGPTWNMIHDPRFVKIENAFIVNRRSIFGGDARVGKQYISSDGTFTSTVADLEQYAEILGEGRHFHNVLVHPNTKCPIRRWLERIHTKTEIKPDARIACICDGNAKRDPKDVKNWKDSQLWQLIRQECPNYFTQKGKPNAIATRLYDLFKADLIGLVDDYAETPLVDEWTLLDTGDVVEQNNNPEFLEQPPMVFMEVDILEKALTYRATLRATAAKILKQCGFANYLKNITASLPDDQPILTDAETDTLLRTIYQSDWPSDKPLLITKLTGIVTAALRTPYGERLEAELARASQESKKLVQGLKNGEIECINQYTEPASDVEQDAHAELVEEIIKNPLKQGLFLIYAEAEKQTMHKGVSSGGLLAASSLATEGVGGEEAICTDPACTECDVAKKVVDILAPVFSAVEFPLSEEGYQKFMQDVKATGFFDKKKKAFEGEFHSAESPERGWEKPIDPENPDDPQPIS